MLILCYFQDMGKKRSGKEAMPSGVIVDYDKSKRMVINGYRRTLYYISCIECGKFRHTNATGLSQIRQGKLQRCNECNMDLRGKNSRLGERGRHINSGGYILRSMNTFSDQERKVLDPMIEGHWREHILEHRAVVALSLNRPLEEYEVVHHKDGNKLNNSIQNLELASRKDHTQDHAAVLQELKQLRVKNKKLQDMLAASM